MNKRKLDNPESEQLIKRHKHDIQNNNMFVDPTNTNNEGVFRRLVPIPWMPTPKRKQMMSEPEQNPHGNKKQKYENNNMDISVNVNRNCMNLYSHSQKKMNMTDEYVCRIHDNNRRTCDIYECSGIRHIKIIHGPASYYS